MSCNREYYNQFDRSKRYFEIRQLSGDVRQSREDNEEQAILRDLVQRVGDGIWLNGDVVKGCTLSLLGDTGYPHLPGYSYYAVAPGWVYTMGIVHETLASPELAVSNVGPQYIGFRLNGRTVTFQEDASLKDPATGVANEGLPGADRLELTVEWVAGAYTGCNTPVDGAGNPLMGIYPVFLFRDGVWLSVPDAVPEPGALMPVIERRTARIHGDFVLEGLELLMGADKPVVTATSAAMTFSGGAAVIDGKVFRVPAKRPLQVDLTQLPAGKTSATEVGFYQNVPYVSSGSAAPKGARVAKRVTLSVKVTQTIKRGNRSEDGIFHLDQLLDVLPGVQVSRILSVTDGSGNSPYEAANGRGGDYQLVQGTRLVGTTLVPVSYLDWSPAYSTSQQPTGGSDYQVEMVYERVLAASAYTWNDDKLVAVLTDGKLANSGAGAGIYAVSLAEPYENGYWNVTFESTDLAFDVYFRDLCNGELAWGLRDTDTEGHVITRWLDTSVSPAVWVVGTTDNPMPRAIRLGAGRITSDGAGGYAVAFTPEDHRHVTQQELRDMINRYADNERFLMDLMTHGGRVSTMVQERLESGEDGFDPYEPRPKQLISYFPDRRSATTKLVYYANGLVHHEEVIGRDAGGRVLYAVSTTFEYDDPEDVADVAWTNVAFALVK